MSSHVSCTLNTVLSALATSCPQVLKQLKEQIAQYGEFEDAKDVSEKLQSNVDVGWGTWCTTLLVQAFKEDTDKIKLRKRVMAALSVLENVHLKEECALVKCLRDRAD